MATVRSERHGQRSVQTRVRAIVVLGEVVGRRRGGHVADQTGRRIGDAKRLLMIVGRVGQARIGAQVVRPMMMMVVASVVARRAMMMVSMMRIVVAPLQRRAVPDEPDDDEDEKETEYVAEHDDD
mgnify:CR=1 FL=1